MNGKEAFFLLIGFLTYLAIGGVVFMYLETGAVEQEIHVLRDLKREVADLMESTNALNTSQLTKDDVWDIVNKMAMICTDDNLLENDTMYVYRHWNFYDAFFFSLTVITTIGYGHLAPISSGGIVFCIFYALLGIPMTGILIAGFGNFFSSILLRAHERSASDRYSATTTLVVNTLFYLVPGTIVFLFLPAIVFSYMEDWSYLVSFYYAFITLTTIGFGDYVGGLGEFEHRWIYQVGLMAWIIIGLGYLAMMLNFISKAMKSKHMKRINKTVGRGFQKTQRMISKEMEEFIRSMNQYSNKIMPKQGRKLKRTLSLPLVRKPSMGELGRTHSDSQLLKNAQKKEQEVYMIQQEAHTNTMGFLMQMAKAFAYGDFGGSGGNVESETTSLRSHGREPSLVELLAEGLRQASRRNSALDGEIALPDRLHPGRRSCDVPTVNHQSWFELPKNNVHPRRKSDGGLYLDIPRSTGMPKPKPILEEVNEIEPKFVNSPKHKKHASSPALMPNGGSQIGKQNGNKDSSFAEIDELLSELKELEELWSTQPPSSTPIRNGSVMNNEHSLHTDNPATSIPVVQVVSPNSASVDVLISNDCDVTSTKPLLAPEKTIAEHTQL